MEGLDVGLGIPIGVPNFDDTNVRRSITERVIGIKDPISGVVRPPIQPTPLGKQRMWKSYASFLRWVEACEGLHNISPWSEEVVIQTRSGDKRAMYENEWQEYINHGRPPVKMSIMMCNARMKYEKLSPKPGKGFADTVPRTYYPRKPLGHILFGKYFFPLEKALYRRLDGYVRKVQRKVGFVGTRRSVVKGMNAEETAELLAEKFKSMQRFGRVAAVSWDATKFDLHVGGFALGQNHRVYRKFLDLDKDQALEFETLSRGVRDYKLVYKIQDMLYIIRHHDKRASGDVDTSGGNILLATLLFMSYLTNVKVPFEFITAGDDCIVFVREVDLERLADLPEYFREFGIESDLSPPVFELEHIKFCQMFPLEMGGKWRLVRHWPGGFQKEVSFAYDLSSPKMMRRYFAAIGAGGLALYSGVPIYQQWALWILRQSQGAEAMKLRREYGRDMWIDRMEAKEAPVGDVARLSFFKATGIPPSHQRTIESRISAWKFMGRESTRQDPMMQESFANGGL